MRRTVRGRLRTRSISGFFLRPSDPFLVDFREIVDESVAANQLADLLPQLVLHLHQVLDVLLLHLELHDRFTNLHQVQTSHLGQLSLLPSAGREMSIKGQ